MNDNTETRYILNADFKVIRKGEFAIPEKEGEFLYSTADQNFTMGQLQSIAEMNKLHVVGKKKADYQTNLNLELEKMENVTEQNGPSQTEIAEKIIRAGIEAGKSDDEMIVEIIQSGVSFRTAGNLFKTTLEKLGIRASTKAVKETAAEILEEMEFAPETFADVEKAISEILEKVEGAEYKQAFLAIRNYAKENEIELPAKPKGKRGATGFKGKLYNWILENPEGTKEQLGEFAESLGKDAEKIIKAFFPVLQLCQKFAAKHG